MDLMNVPAKFEVRSFTRSWDNSEYLKNFVQAMDTPFKVTQGDWFWYQSKARIWLPIGP